MSRQLIAEMLDEQIEINQHGVKTFTAFAVMMGLLAGGHFWIDGTSGVFWLIVGVACLFVAFALHAHSLVVRLRRARERVGVV